MTDPRIVTDFILEWEFNCTAELKIFDWTKRCSLIASISHVPLNMNEYVNEITQAQNHNCRGALMKTN